MRAQGWEFFLKRGVMFVMGTNQDAVPVPATRFRGFHQNQHLAFEEIDGQSAKHALGKEGLVIGKGLDNPLVLER